MHIQGSLRPKTRDQQASDCWAVVLFNWMNSKTQSFKYRGSCLLSWLVRAGELFSNPQDWWSTTARPFVWWGGKPIARTSQCNTASEMAQQQSFGPSCRHRIGGDRRAWLDCEFRSIRDWTSESECSKSSSRRKWSSNTVPSREVPPDST